MVLKLLSIAWDDTLHSSRLWAVSGFGQQDNAINFFDVVCVVGCALRLWWVLRGGLLCLGKVMLALWVWVTGFYLLLGRSFHPPAFISLLGLGTIKFCSICDANLSQDSWTL